MCYSKASIRFNGPFSGTTQVSRYQKGKTNLDFTEEREWWHQLGHMQVCTSLQTDNHASTPPLSFYRPDALPAAQPTVEHSNSGKKVSIRFDSILATESIFSIRFDLPIWYICRLYTDIQIVMMVSLVKGLAACLYAVVHSVPYQYQLDNFQQVKNVSKVLNAANNDSAYFLAETVQ